jgi:TonB family protein
MARRPNLRAARPRFAADSEWGRAERRDRRRAVLTSAIVHGCLLALLGPSIPPRAARALASEPAYQGFEVSIPPDEEVRRMLAPEPTRAAPRLATPSDQPSSRPLEGAPRLDLAPLLPDLRPQVTTPQVGIFAAPGELLEPEARLGLLSIELDAARRARPEVLQDGLAGSPALEGGASATSGGSFEGLGSGMLVLDGRTANAVTLYREEAPYTERMRSFGLAGTCEVEMRVDADGLVAEASVVQSSGSELLDAASVAAALNWRFEPRALEARGVYRCRYRFRFDANRASNPETP